MLPASPPLPTLPSLGHPTPCRGLQCVEVMLSLISDSLDAWRTRQYDYYQRVLNGIL